MLECFADRLDTMLKVEYILIVTTYYCNGVETSDLILGGYPLAMRSPVGMGRSQGVLSGLNCIGTEGNISLCQDNGGRCTRVAAGVICPILTNGWLNCYYSIVTLSLLRVFHSIGMH